MLNISSIYTSEKHQVAVIHLPISLVGIVAIQYAGICMLLIVFRFIIFVTESMELMSISVPYCKTIHPLLVQS